jgi:hypothetical protein
VATPQLSITRIRNLLPEAKDLDDRELVSLWSQAANRPFEDVANEVGLPRTGLVSEVVDQFGAGATVGVPRLVGQGLQFAARNLGSEEGLVSRAGRAIEEGAERRAVTRQPDLRGRNYVSEALILGANAAPASLVGLAAAAPLAATGVGLPAALAIGATATGTLFGTAQGEETYRRVLEETGDEAAAREASLLTAGGSALVEAGASYLGGRLITGAARSLGGQRAMGAVLNQFKNPQVYKEFSKALAINYPVQIGTEVAQDVGSSMIEELYGAAPEDLSAIAGESAQAAFGLTTLFGFGGLGSATVRSRNAERLRRAIEGDASIPQEEQRAAVDTVRQFALSEGVAPERVTPWVSGMLNKIDAQNRNIAKMEESVSQVAQARRVLGQFEPDSEEALAATSTLEESTRAFEQAASELSGITMREVATGAQRELTVGEAALRDAGIFPVWAAQPPKDVDAETDLTAPTAPETPADQLALFARKLMEVEDATAELTRAARQEEMTEGVAPVEGVDVTTTSPVTAQDVTQGEQPSPVVEASVAPSAVAQVDTSVPLEGKAEDFNNQQDAIREDQAVEQAVKSLSAQVQSDTDARSPGKIGFPQPVLAAIGASVFKGRAQPVRVKRKPAIDAAATTEWGERIGAVATAAVQLADAYNALLGKSQVAKSDRSGTSGRAAQTAKAAVQTMTEADTTVQAAIDNLQQVVAQSGGTARDVDAVVAATKAVIQQRKSKGLSRDAYKRAVAIDSGLSRAWQAKRTGVYGTESDAAFYVRGAEARESTEFNEAAGVAAEDAVARGALAPEDVARFVGEQQPVPMAVSEGYAVGGNPNVDTSGNTAFENLLNRLRTGATAYESTLVRAIDQVRQTMAAAGVEPNIVFSEDTPGYSPDTNTINLSYTPSPEVQLHEALHAVLQWFVYNNPENSVVVDLKSDLQKVIDYDGPLTGQAAQIQQMLVDMVGDKSELDAVLELVSYTNTHAQFRRALDNIPSDTPRTFAEALTKVWSSIMNAVKELLGVKQTVARDIMGRSFELLRQAAMTKAGDVKLSPQGNRLLAAIRNEQEAIEASGMSATDYRKYARDTAPKEAWTNMLWDAVQIGAPAKVVAQVGKDAAQYIRKNLPEVEVAISLLNSNFSVPQLVKKLKFSYKRLRNAPYQIVELLLQDVTSRTPAEQLAIRAYMDGDKTALAGLKNPERIQMLADLLVKHIETQVSYLPKQQRDFFKNRTLSESMAYVSELNEVAQHNLLSGGLGRILGLKVVVEPAITWDSAWYNKDANGDIDLGDNYYAVYGQDQINPANKTPLLQGFMSKEVFEAKGTPLGLGVDTSRTWRIDEAGKGGYKFSSSKNYSEARAAATGQQFADGLRNTVAALAANQANIYMLANLHRMGREGYTDADIKAGKDPDANALALNSLAQIERVFGTKINPTQVLDVANVPTDRGALRKLRNRYRASGTWVKMPDRSGYGPLRGKYVPGPVWNSLMDMNDRTPTLGVTAGKLMQFFKKSKTTLNPGTHVTNTVTNFTLAYMHDLSAEQLTDAFKIYAYFKASPGRLTAFQRQVMSSFIESGAMLGDLSTAEIKQDLHKSMAEQYNPRRDDSVMNKLVEFAGYEDSKTRRLMALAKKLGVSVDEKMAELYSAEDNVFRLAIFMKRIGEMQQAAGTDTITEQMVENGGIAARQAYVDYDIDAPAIRYLRQTWMPFVSFTYGIVPVLGRIALTQPWKIANIITGMYIAGAALAAASDGDDEEIRNAGPEYLRDRMFGIGPYMHMRLPFGGADNPTYIRVGDYFPLAGSTGGMPNGFMGQSWWPQGLSPSNPFITTILALFGGVDAYTGKSIHEVTDTDFQKIGNIGRTVYDAYTVPLVSSRNAETVASAIRGDTTMTGASVNPTAFARMMGLRLYSIDMEEAAMFQQFAVDGIRRDYGIAMSRLKREAAQNGWLDYDKLDKELSKLMERMEKEIAAARGEE